VNALDTFFFAIFPYMCLTSFVVGHIWRYRYDKFGWTTRSSQWYENRLLRWASPMFHFGLLGVLLGHVGGLLIPESWTNAVGINEHIYHLVAVSLGSFCGVVMLIGLVGLIWRRRSTPAVFRATTKMDKAMYAVLGTVIGLGMFNTIYWQIIAGGYNYRESVSIWFRSIFYFNPDVTLIADAPLSFQLHAIAAFSLFALWPFTRLVHVLSAPLGYLWRPYVVYRSRDHHSQPGNRDPRPGWERPGLEQTRK
jgi:nitrate reductase gamma subunit